MRSDHVVAHKRLQSEQINAKYPVQEFVLETSLKSNVARSTFYQHLYILRRSFYALPY